MFTKKSLGILLLLTIGGGVFYAVRSSSTKVNPNEKYEKIMQLVGEMLEDAHYSPRSINDRFSRDVLKKYLKRLDPEKIYFLASDLERFKAIETNIDDEIKGAELKSFFMINEVFKKRVTEVSASYKVILNKPFDFSIDEKYVEVTEQTPYPKSSEMRQEQWRKKLKYQVLDKYVELVEMQEKRPDTSTAPLKSPKELEKEARAKVEKVYNRIFERFKNRLKDDDRFHWLVDDIAMTMDPHTNYYAPIEKRSFDEQMSGEFYGIGASLQEEDGNIKIATIVTGSPAQKSGEIQIGDFILKVAQGDQEPQDLTGFDVTDAVRIIRGKKDTEVRLTIKKPDGTVKTIRLIREKINLDDTYAKSAVINTDDGTRIGYIYLPEFYANFQDPNGARCAPDVAKEIKKLKEENISGIILDLRNNGGGSLMDVVQMVGFFIDEGPVVQVKSKDETPTILRDREKGTLWDGPLTVMVNEFSASASEIFAAAIQDYQRGIVIGSTSTYGKGTVQRNMELDKTGWLTGNPQDLGSVKMTIQKFYRINGGSTQLRGVVPDIIMPDQYEYLKMREKDEMFAMEWDEITPAFYTKWKSDYDLDKIIKKSRTRLADNPNMNEMKKHIKNLEVFSDNKYYTLKLASYKSEKKMMAETVKAIDTLLKLNEPLKIVNLTKDMTRINADSMKIERNTQFLKFRKSDVHLGETVQIMRDMIQDTRMAARKRKE
jgi:carboxyl-terminal processing protease